MIAGLTGRLRAIIKSGLILPGLVVVFLVPVFLVLHELSHAAGFLAQGFRTCVYLNSAVPFQEGRQVAALLGGILGPFFTLAVTLSALAIHQFSKRFSTATLLVAVANSPHAASSLLTVPIFARSDEYNLAVLLPQTEAFVDDLTARSVNYPEWLLLVLVLAVIPVAITWFLIHHGNPLGRTYPVKWAYALWVVAVLSGEVWQLLSMKMDWRLCL